MFTKTMKNLLALVPMSSGTNTKEVTGFTFKNYAGTNFNHSTRMYGSFPGITAMSFSISNNANGIKVGSGTTEPTENDYNLESLITSGLSGSIVSQDRLIENGILIFRIGLAVTNTSSSNDVSISEIGFFQNTAYGSGSNTQVAMLDRALLDDPITIPSGESATITYELKIPVPSSSS